LRLGGQKKQVRENTHKETKKQEQRTNRYERKYSDKAQKKQKQNEHQELVKNTGTAKRLGRNEEGDSFCK
jgi:hypothetical protein